MTTTTTDSSKRSYRIITAAIIIAAVITIVKLGNRWYLDKQHGLSAQCFQTAQGWGYDILAGKKIVIHQPMVPGQPGNKGFVTEQDAAAAAETVIRNIKSHGQP